jgi:hypothetical protein
MIRSTLLILGVCTLTFAGCARHHVAERNAGRIDGAKSISTSTDTSWTIESEPSAGAEDE